MNLHLDPHPPTHTTPPPHTHLQSECVPHCLVHLHELEGNAAVAVNGTHIQHTQCCQLTTKCSPSVCPNVSSIPKTKPAPLPAIPPLRPPLTPLLPPLPPPPKYPHPPAVRVCAPLPRTSPLPAPKHPPPPTYTHAQTHTTPPSTHTHTPSPHTLTHLQCKCVPHCLVHLHQLKGNAAVAVNGTHIQHTQCSQLTPKCSQPECKLGHVGPIKAVYAVGAQHTVLQLGFRGRHARFRAHHAGFRVSCVGVLVTGRGGAT
jgi:hypothetical protein